MKIIIFFIPLLFLNSCINDIVDVININSRHSEEIAAHLEINGNFINSESNPAMVNVDEVFENSNNYLIIDVRENQEFSEGHIKNAIHSEMFNVLDFLEATNLDNYPKIIIVCKNGHKSGFIVSLLRMLDYDNAYSLNYGMGYWNEKFSSIWFNNISTSSFTGFYTRRIYPKLKLKQSLPELDFEDGLTIKEKIRERVKVLLRSDFSNSTMNMAKFESLYSYKSRNYSNMYLISYGDNYLYNSLHFSNTSSLPPVNSGGHPISAIQYNPFPANDLQLAYDLLTLPQDRKILIYSYNGQRSSYILAYLQLLGYDATIIEYGALSLMSFGFRDRTLYYNARSKTWHSTYVDNHATQYGFWIENIKNYSLETGG